MLNDFLITQGHKTTTQHTYAFVHAKNVLHNGPKLVDFSSQTSRYHLFLAQKTVLDFISKQKVLS